MVCHPATIGHSVSVPSRPRLSSAHTAPSTPTTTLCSSKQSFPLPPSDVSHLCFRQCGVVSLGPGWGCCSTGALKIASVAILGRAGFYRPEKQSSPWAPCLLMLRQHGRHVRLLFRTGSLAPLPVFSKEQNYIRMLQIIPRLELPGRL